MVGSVGYVGLAEGGEPEKVVDGDPDVGYGSSEVAEVEGMRPAEIRAL